METQFQVRPKEGAAKKGDCEVHCIYKNVNAQNYSQILLGLFVNAKFM